MRLHRYIHCIMNSHNVFYLRMMAWSHQNIFLSGVTVDLLQVQAFKHKLK